MTFKKLLIILTITVTALILALLSTSYAWYQFDNAVTTFNNVQTFNDGIDELAVVFTNNNNINTTVGIPILAAEVEELSSKTNFTITPSADLLSGKEVAYQIELVNLNIDSTLTSTRDLKYSLLETIGTGTPTTIASGNFYNVTQKNLVIKQMTKIPSYNLGLTYSYEFRLWLEETGENQNDLMGKTITGKIKISTAVR